MTPLIYYILFADHCFFSIIISFCFAILVIQSLTIGLQSQTTRGFLSLTYKLTNRPMANLVYNILEHTARYVGLLLAHAEGFGRGFFSPLGKKIAYY